MNILPKKLNSPVVQWGVIIGSIIGLHYVVRYFSKNEEIIEGPLGKKDDVRLSEPFATNNKTYYATIWGYRNEWHSLRGWNSKSEAQKRYINRAIDNYANGYTFNTGDNLTNACYACYTMSADLANEVFPLTWPLPTKEK